MIRSEELASTGSSPGTPIVTSESSSPAASAMIAAGRACRPTADPTVTVLVGMRSPLVGQAVGRNGCSDGGEVLAVGGEECLGRDDGGCSDDHAEDQGDEVAEDVV